MFGEASLADQLSKKEKKKKKSTDVRSEYGLWSALLSAFNLTDEFWAES